VSFKKSGSITFRFCMMPGRVSFAVFAPKLINLWGVVPDDDSGRRISMVLASGQGAVYSVHALFLFARSICRIGGQIFARARGGADLGCDL
jgi:hypothetical protein